MRALDLLLPSNRKTGCQLCSCAEESLHLSIDREEVIGRDYGIPAHAGERMKGPCGMNQRERRRR